MVKNAVCENLKPGIDFMQNCKGLAGIGENKAGMKIICILIFEI